MHNGNKLSKRALPNAPLLASADLAGAQDTRIRIDTVHQVKGESLDAVLYIASKGHAQAMIDGVDTELGRIGYVAVTRAKDLFWLGVPASALTELRGPLIALGFRERNASLDRRRVSVVIGRLPQIAPKKHWMPSLWQSGTWRPSASASPGTTSWSSEVEHTIACGRGLPARPQSDSSEGFAMRSRTQALTCAMPLDIFKISTLRK